MSKFLTRDEILAKRCFGVKELDIPDFGVVCIRKWSGKDRAKFLQASIRPEGDSIGVNYDNIFDNMALVVAISLCDDQGQRLFAESDVDLIGTDMDANTIQCIYEEALKLNTLNATAVSDAAKNSKSTQREDSTSNLPETSDVQEMNSLTE